MVLLGEGTAVTMLSRPAAATRIESIILSLVVCGGFEQRIEFSDIFVGLGKRLGIYELS